MLKVVVVMMICHRFCAPSIIDYSLTKMLTINSSGSYFGYSVLLQKGNPPVVIVGAPKLIHGYENTGSIYKCNLDNSQCQEFRYSRELTGILTRDKNGYFFGSVLDGDYTAGGHIFTCSPRFITSFQQGTDYFINGRCYKLLNSNNVNSIPKLMLPLRKYSQISVQQGFPFYDAGFGEAGFSIIYLNDENELLIGAPGKSVWNGAVIRSKVNLDINDLLYFQNDVKQFRDSYFGYSVEWGRFLRHSKKIWYLSGGPRGCELMGAVIFFNQETVALKKFCGEEFGAYFGASLLVIHKENEGDDFLVGAPISAGNSFDEGCVYYYKNKNDGTFHTPIKLTRQKTLSRFGTVMANIGDIDLDSFPDCAISAPYEDDGIGAVYLYFGAKDGFNNDRYERIAPSSFSAVYPKHVKGFGLGISKGNDVNNDKHNDVVIGAYLNDQIFFFPTNQVIDVVKNVTSNMKTLLTSTTTFAVIYCLKFSFRNKNNVTEKTFFINLVSEDERIINEHNVSEIVTLKPNEIFCNNQTIYLKNSNLNLEPIIFRFGHKLNSGHDLLTKDVLSIPVSYECGDDNICQTNLNIKENIGNRTKIIIGETNELRVNVTISNFGESAYQTKLYMKLPPEISLINLRECDFENESYVCLVAPILKGTIEKTFLLDLTNLQPDSSYLRIHFSVNSFGNDADLSDNTLQLQIPAVLQNNPHLDSRSSPETIFLNHSEKFTEFTHTFVVGNQGPSPVHLNLIILVPQVIMNQTDVLKIRSADGSISGIPSTCEIVGSRASYLPTRIIDYTVEEKNLKCTGSEYCTVVICQAGFIPKSNQNAVFEVRMMLQTKPLERIIESGGKLLVTSSAYFQNNTDSFSTTTSTLIYGIAPSAEIPMWVYALSIILGFLLLLIMVYLLYKCNFFKRSYKEKLLEESQSIGAELSEEACSEGEL